MIPTKIRSATSRMFWSIESGKIAALIVGVGGFLGAGEKDVAVPFEAVHPTMKDKKWWLVMNATKDSLKSAPGFQVRL